jgi:adenylate cyclase
VPAQLVRQLIETKQEATISGQRRNLSVFFSDIQDFTGISESLTPNELASQLSEYFTVMTDVIIKHSGTVDKFIGDAVMAFWGAPVEMKSHASEACHAALECQKKIKELNQKWSNEGKKPFHTRIGIGTGEIIVGNMGSDQRLNYTVIGDTVNLASRLEGLNKDYGTKIIVSQSTVEHLSDDFALRLLDFVHAKGKLEPATIYELVAEKGDISTLDLECVKSFNEAMTLYKEREWDKAMKIFKRFCDKKPHDRACLILMERCAAYKIIPPHEDWCGEAVRGKV